MLAFRPTFLESWPISRQHPGPPSILTTPYIPVPFKKGLLPLHSLFLHLPQGSTHLPPPFSLSPYLSLSLSPLPSLHQIKLSTVCMVSLSLTHCGAAWLHPPRPLCPSIITVRRGAPLCSCGEASVLLGADLPVWLGLRSPMLFPISFHPPLL